MKNVTKEQIERMNWTGALQLAEIIVSGIREMAEQVIQNPTEDDIEHVRNVLQSAQYDGLTFGNGETALKYFNDRLRETGYGVAS